MGQEDICVFLKKNIPKKYTSREISEHLNRGVSSTTLSCKKLRESNFIKYDKKKIKLTRNSLLIYHYWVEE